ncbi:hypothetical protein P152DRAFT_513779 [Eremomyces bilateralis CBS 781.70]|uniref:Apple domain-containing protein n=1 Tax=Eremomyces bilateralis CBS 781.70 TaxID=1392243 RepID=A0A6G1G673_9PEZI|nr:uncharacterized protein P152DRAFT_513779 [Eremomyces bilateralis CBS 781.70]KAF1813563.1 hypothetical protein P152DRAFT_513779 [Eremomyces bilateralis CBS 781.70]
MRFSVLASAVASLAVGGLAEADGTKQVHQVRHDECAPLFSGSGPTISPDTPEAFLNSQGLKVQALRMALSAAALTPDGYRSAFSGLQAFVSTDSFQAVHILQQYDPVVCAELCNQSEGCLGFNVFIERNPSAVPDDGDCSNPPSITNFKCTIFSSSITSDLATDAVTMAYGFSVVVTGSNGYNKVAAPQSSAGDGAPEQLPAAIVAPDASTYLGYTFYKFSQGGTDSPGQCAAACGGKSGCTFFNSYILSMNDVPQGLYCSLYSTAWGAEFATNSGSYSGLDKFTVSRSEGYRIQ